MAWVENSLSRYCSVHHWWRSSLYVASQLGIFYPIHFWGKLYQEQRNNEIKAFYKSNNPKYKVATAQVSRDGTASRKTKRGGTETAKTARDREKESETWMPFKWIRCVGGSGRWMVRGSGEDRACLWLMVVRFHVDGCPSFLLASTHAKSNCQHHHTKWTSVHAWCKKVRRGSKHALP